MGDISKECGNIFVFVSSIKTFEISVISVVKFLITCLVSELLEDKEEQIH